MKETKYIIEKGDILLDLIKRISELENERDKGVERLKKLEEEFVNKLDTSFEINKIHTCLDNFEKRIAKLESALNQSQQKVPHKCPVCSSNGYVYKTFNDFGAVVERIECHACQGTGIVWG